MIKLICSHNDLANEFIEIIGADGVSFDGGERTAAIITTVEDALVASFDARGLHFFMGGDLSDYCCRKFIDAGAKEYLSIERLAKSFSASMEDVFNYFIFGNEIAGTLYGLPNDIIHLVESQENPEIPSTIRAFIRYQAIRLFVKRSYLGKCGREMTTGFLVNGNEIGPINCDGKISLIGKDFRTEEYPFICLRCGKTYKTPPQGIEIDKDFTILDR